MGSLKKIRQRHQAIKSQIDTQMTEDVGRLLFPRTFTKWLNLGVLVFNRREGMYSFAKRPILQEDRLIEYVNSNPHSTTEQIACDLDIDERLCYVALMTLKSKSREEEFLFYSDGEWCIYDSIDMSFLYWSIESPTDLVYEKDMLGVLANHIRDVFNAKESFEVVERKYNDAQQGLEEKKKKFKSHLEDLDLI